ncbi:hypothetical protein GCM10023259_083050 [Thermocatellispora tengchongensis]
MREDKVLDFGIDDVDGRLFVRDELGGSVTAFFSRRIDPSVPGTVTRDGEPVTHRVKDLDLSGICQVSPSCWPSTSSAGSRFTGAITAARRRGGQALHAFRASYQSGGDAVPGPGVLARARAASDVGIVVLTRASGQNTDNGCGRGERLPRGGRGAPHTTGRRCGRPPPDAVNPVWCAIPAACCSARWSPRRRRCNC